MEQGKGYLRSYILVLIDIAAASITMTIFMPLLPIYYSMITNGKGSDAVSGLLVSIFTIAALLSRPFLAAAIDRRGRKMFVILGLLLIAVGGFGYRIASAIGVLMIFRVIHGIGYSSTTNASGAIVADILPPEKRQKGMGMYGIVMAAALALGPALGFAVFHATGDIKNSFLTAAAIAVASAGCSLLLPADQTAVHARASKKISLADGYEKSAYGPALVMLFVAFSYAGVMTFLSKYATTVLGISDFTPFFLLYALSLLLVRLFLNRLPAGRSITSFIVPGMILMCAGQLIFAVCTTMGWMLAGGCLFGLGYGSVQPTLMTLTLSGCAPQRRGAANSTFFTAMDLGIGLGSFVWGIVAARLSYPAVFLGGVIFMAVGLVLDLALQKKTKKAD